MGRAFEVRWSGELPGTPSEVWDAITARTGGWLWPISYEPREGGAETGLNGNGGTVTAWDPPRRFGVVSAEGDNALDYRLDGTHLDYTQRGEFDEAEYDVQFDACRRHTDFYYHSLGQYLGHFAGRELTYATIDLPPETTMAGLRRMVGIPDDATVGDRVRLTAGDAKPVDGVVDYATAPFLGVRAQSGLYRFFGRDEWGWPVGVAVHLVEGDAKAWLKGIR